VAKVQSSDLGTQPISKLIVSQSVPASIGFLVMSIYMIVDTIFVGQFVGSIAIAAITVVLPITFLIASIGMSIGVGGASIISRALGVGNDELASQTFGNQISLVATLSVLFVSLGFYFDQPILRFFGAKGDILAPAESYFHIILLGVPFLAWAMMSNNVIRASGYPKVAMWTMLIPALFNLIFDPILIVWLKMGLEGAAWATSISYALSAGYACWFFTKGKSELRIKSSHFPLRKKIVQEMLALGFVTLARQGAISLLAIVLNNTLFKFGTELHVAIYGIVSRMMMFAFFPVIGITQGFLPITGFNYGAGHYDRVREVIKKSILYGTVITIGIYALIILFNEPIVRIFTTDAFLIAETPRALLLVFLASPVILTQLIGSAYFQAIGKAVPALLLTLTKQGFFLIPLVLIMPHYFGIDGIWYSFPIADVLSTLVTLVFLRRAMVRLPDSVIVVSDDSE